MMNANQFLDMIQPEDNTSCFRLAKIDPSYSSGKPKVIFDGESSVTSKQYSYLASYTPVANERVLLAMVSGTYVIIGRLIS